MEAFIDKPLDELELKDIRAIMNKVKFPRKLDILVFYQLTGRLPHEGELKKLIKAYDGRDSNAVKFVEKVEAFIDKPLDELELKDIRAIMNKVKFPRKLDILVFYQLTGRLPHEGLEFRDKDFIIHFYDTFVAASVKLLRKWLDVELMYYTIFLRRLERNQMLIYSHS